MNVWNEVSMRASVCLGTVFLSIALAGCLECRRDRHGSGYITEVFSSEITVIPETLPHGRTVEAVIISVGDAEDWFAGQPTLRSAITSDFAKVWAAQQNALGNHLIIVVKVFGAYSTSSGTAVYADVYSQWWSVVNERLSEGSGSHFPIRLRFIGTAGRVRLAGYDVPGDGNLFAGGVRELFPEPYASRILQMPGGDSRLRDANRVLATAWASRLEHN